MTKRSKETINYLSNMFFSSGKAPITARTLARLILSSIKLQPVAITAQLTGMIAFLAMFWTSDINRIFLVIWFATGVLQIYCALHYTRGFWMDRDRVARVRRWIRRWIALAIFAGVIWGVAGAAFLVPLSGISQVLTVAIVVAVTFASWPVYSCWIPSLTAFTLLSLTPLTISIAAQYGVSQAMMAVVLAVVTGFILYSGHKLNEMLVSSILNDTENQRLVQRLKREVTLSEASRRQTQAESEKRGRFFAAANHDLRQPLQAMGIYLDILKRRATPQTMPVIHQLSVTSSAISTLVEQILDVSRMAFGQIEVHLETVAIPVLFEELTQEFTELAAQKGLSFRAKALPLTITSDVQLLKRVLKNLIGNAITYTSSGGVLLACRQLNSGQIEINVYDTGPGLGAQEKQRIFETFYRGQAGREKPGSGFGLGLSIVQGICRQLGIPLTVNSRVGHGSVFKLRFMKAAEPMGIIAENTTLLERCEMVEGVIALVEDNTYVRSAMESMLSSWGAEVIATAEPDEAFYGTCLSAGDTLVALISDYNLGDGVPNGLEVAAKLEHVMARKLPTLLLTAVAFDLIESDYRRGHARSPESMPGKLPLVLQKPASAEKLNQSLIGIIAQR